MKKIPSYKLEIKAILLLLLQYLADHHARNVTEAVEKILMKYFPEDMEERKSQYEEEMAEFARHEYLYFVSYMMFVRKL